MASAEDMTWHIRLLVAANCLLLSPATGRGRGEHVYVGKKEKGHVEQAAGNKTPGSREQ